MSDREVGAQGWAGEYSGAKNRWYRKTEQIYTFSLSVNIDLKNESKEKCDYDPCLEIHPSEEVTLSLIYSFKSDLFAKI